MKVRDTRVNQGGLLRCCLATLGEEAEGDRDFEPGDTLDCKYEEPGNQQMRLNADNVWEWNHE